MFLIVHFCVFVPSAGRLPEVDVLDVDTEVRGRGSAGEEAVGLRDGGAALSAPAPVRQGAVRRRARLHLHRQPGGDGGGGGHDEEDGGGGDDDGGQRRRRHIEIMNCTILLINELLANVNES